jgi:hypothetical protein
LLKGLVSHSVQTYHHCPASLLLSLQGRTGYLQWRERLKSSHAATVVGLMEQAGYDAAACEKVKRWILKKDIKTDAENQVRWRSKVAPVLYSNSLPGLVGSRA